jgi:hypothetical protein
MPIPPIDICNELSKVVIRAFAFLDLALKWNLMIIPGQKRFTGS